MSRGLGWIQGYPGRNMTMFQGYTQHYSALQMLMLASTNGDSSDVRKNGAINRMVLLINGYVHDMTGRLHQ